MHIFPCRSHFLDKIESSSKMERGGFHGYRGNANSNSASPSSGLKLTSNGSSSGSSSAARAEENNECTVREQDRFMPIANVIRIMRKILPPHAKISDDAKETIQECVSEYISFVTGEANERCQREQRKTITAEDILWAMSKLGFDDYIEPLTIFLHRYREVEGDRGSVRGDPLVRRPVVDYGGYSFGPPPPMGQHSNGFAPAPGMGGYMNDAAAGRGSSSQAPSAPNGQPNGHYK